MLHARDKREVWEEKSSAQVTQEKCGLKIRWETDIAQMGFFCKITKKKKEKLYYNCAEQ